MSIGMTWDQYWYGDVWMAETFREAERLRIERINSQAHLMGLYVYEALCDVSPILHAFAKKGTKPIPYPTEPYGLSQKESPKKEEGPKLSEEEIAKKKAQIRGLQAMLYGH